MAKNDENCWNTKTLENQDQSFWTQHIAYAKYAYPQLSNQNFDKNLIFDQKLVFWAQNCPKWQKYVFSPVIRIIIFGIRA